MSVTEQARHQLFSWYEGAMGAEMAATMMSLLPPVGWGEVATKRDLAVLEGVLRSDLSGVELRLDAQLARFDRSLTRSFVTWLLASQATVIAAISTIVVVH